MESAPQEKIKRATGDGGQGRHAVNDDYVHFDCREELAEDLFSLPCLVEPNRLM